MLIVKDKPTGIDWYIQKFQTFLHDRLMKLWALNPAVAAQNALYQSYPRCYRNKLQNGSFIAQHYTGNDQYSPDVYWDAALNAITFFGVGTTVKKGVLESAEVHLVFFTNLAKLKPTITHRCDSEVRGEIIKMIGKNNFGFCYNGYETGLENVLKEYPGSFRDERLKAVDMQPAHCFRLNFTLTFNSNKVC